MKRFFLTVMMFLLLVSSVWAGIEFNAVRLRAEIMTGSLERVEKNFIEIRDEEDGLVKRLTCFSADKKFKVGERVRVRYESRTALVEWIKKMTPVEYRKDGQNAGYIYKK